MMLSAPKLIAEHATPSELTNSLMTEEQKRRSGMGAVLGGVLLLGAGMTSLGLATLTQEVPQLSESNFLVVDELPAQPEDPIVVEKVDAHPQVGVSVHIDR